MSRESILYSISSLVLSQCKDLRGVDMRGFRSIDNSVIKIILDELMMV